MKISRILSALALGAAALSINAQNNIVEEVAWWIGDQPIYKSEVEEMYQTMMYEKTPIDGDPYCVIPEQIAVEKLFLHQAEIDSVEVQDAMVISEVERRINYMITQLGTQEKLEQFYRRPLPEIREQMIDAMRNNYKVSEVQKNLTQDIKTTPSDVRRYFADVPKDSVPYVPLQVEAQILTLNPVIPREEIDEVKARLRDYTDKVNSGESDFSTLAILYSQDPGSSLRGGELGFMGRGQLDPDFAAVAFNLNDPKKVSKIVESQYGFHIIQLIEKRGDRINVRHILLQPRVSDKDLTDAINRLDSIRADMLAEKFTFEEAVSVLSQDKDTRNNRGQMFNKETGSTRFEMADLPQEVSKAVANMSVGQISKPFIMKDERNRDVVAIVKLSNRIDGHKANMSDDYELIKVMYENSRKDKIISDWINSKIKDTYVRIEDGWRDCDFKHEGWIKTSNSK